MSKAKHEHNPVIHDCSAFKRWSRDERKIQKGNIGGYVSDLRRISGELGIEISPETIRNYIDADKLADRLAEKNIDKNLGGGYRNAARRYADFVQASKSAEEDDETRCNEADSPANHDVSEADEETEADADRQEVPEPYDIHSALQGIFVSYQQLTRILDSIKRRKNLILQGPPGVGKTFIARRIAWCLIGRKDSNPVEMMQFHQSYEVDPIGWTGIANQ